MRTRILVAVAAAVLLSGAGLYLVSGGSTPKVEAWHPVRQPLAQTLLVTGRLVPPRQLDLGALVQSTVAEIEVDEGDTVEAGAVLVQLADEEAQARLEEAEARVREAEARLVRVRGVGRQLADEKLEQARIEAEEAERAFARAQQLFDAKSLAAQDYDTAKSRRDGAVSRRVAARLESVASGAGGADVQAAAATLAQAQANLELARTALDRTTVRAPVAGRVLVRDVEIGQVVRPGDVLITLAGEGPLEVRIHPDEYHLGSLALGQTALVLAEAFPDRPLKAEVDHIAPRVDPNRGTVEVRLALRDEIGDLALKPEMSTTVEVVLGKREDALVLPRYAVRDLGTANPWVLVEEDGIARRRDVRLGLEGTDDVEIVEGLDTTSLVLDAESGIEPDAKVRARVVSLPTP